MHKLTKLNTVMIEHNLMIIKFNNNNDNDNK